MIDRTTTTGCPKLHIAHRCYPRPSILRRGTKAGRSLTPQHSKPSRLLRSTPPPRPQLHAYIVQQFTAMTEMFCYRPPSACGDTVDRSRNETITRTPPRLHRSVPLLARIPCHVGFFVFRRVAFSGLLVHYLVVEHSLFFAEACPPRDGKLHRSFSCNLKITRKLL